MSPSASQEGSRGALSGHLEDLFAFAQIVAADPDEAIDLVEETVRRARAGGLATSSTDEGAVEHTRIALYRILLEVQAGRAALRDHARHDAASSGGAMSGMTVRIAERFVDAAMPAAFASLDRDQRIFLMLCDVQRMSCAEAGRVLGVDADAACSRLEAARSALDTALTSGASPVERRLLERGLSGNWKRQALRRMVETELSAVPPTLQPALMEMAGGGPTQASPEKATSELPEKKRGVASIVRRAAAVLVVIAVAGLLGYGFSTFTSRGPDLNLISLSANQAADTEVAFQTTSAEQAERFVRDRIGRRITIPSIRQAALQGISIRDVSDGAEAPVIVYSSVDGTSSIVVYVYSYAFLDAHRRRLELPEGVLTQIETEGNFDLHDFGESRALVWRQRDDIYVAVTDGDADDLRDRITFPS